MFQFENNTGDAINKTHHLLNGLKKDFNSQSISYDSDESLLIRNDSNEAIAFIAKYVLFKEKESITYCDFDLLSVDNEVSLL